MAKSKHWLYIAIVFISAFLSFSIQPLFSKLLLPYFGGSATVWLASSFFFQLLLVLSYLYVFSLRNFSVKQQLTTHLITISCILLVSLLPLTQLPIGLLAIHTITSALPVTAGYAPFSIMAAGFQSIGLAIFLLGTTSTFTQLIISKIYKDNPYLLYRASNIGSFLGLLSYPFIIEPFFSLHMQSLLWSISFIGIVILIGVGILQEQKAASAQIPDTLPNESAPSRLLIFQWLIVAALPVALSLAVTNHITTGVAPSPYLWILPLALYLLSFSLAFGVVSLQSLLILLTIVSTWLGLLSSITETNSSRQYMLTTSILLISSFMGGLLSHSWLYAKRPTPQFLSNFYLCCAVGGLLGGAFVNVLAPSLFNDYWELPVLLAIILAFAVWLYSRARQLQLVVLNRTLYIHTLFIIASSSFFLVIFVLAFLQANANHPPMYKERNFYGTVKVVEEGSTRKLLNGSIIHGTQDAQSPTQATGYYDATSGIGQTLMLLQQQKASLHIGVIGLGTGTLTTYCRPADEFTFFEINPAVITVAEEYFSYLRLCSNTSVILGDARKNLEKEITQTPRYDLLVLDAFTDDSIPTHLLTVEANQLYLSLLADDGVVVYHLSNRYLALDRVIYDFADKNQLFIKPILTNKRDESIALPSYWVILSRSPEIIDMVHTSPELEEYRPDKTIEWQDDYTNLLGVLKKVW